MRSIPYMRKASPKPNFGSNSVKKNQFAKIPEGYQCSSLNSFPPDELIGSVEQPVSMNG